MSHEIILLVINDRTELARIERFLRDWDTIPICALSPDEAVKMVDETDFWKGLSLVISDLNQAVDGLKLCDTAKARNPELPAIILCNPTWAECYRSNLELSANKVILTPININNLRLAIEELTGCKFPVQA